MSIDYTKIDQSEVRDELITLLKQTPTFKDANFSGTALYDLANNMSYVSSLYGFYLNNVANEPFIDSCKQYKNINRVSNNLMYNPVGQGSAEVNVVSALTKDYVLNNTEGFIEIPTYSLFPSTKTTTNGKEFSFTNPITLSVQVKQFGANQIKEKDILYAGEVDGSDLEADKLIIEAFTKKPIHFIDGDTEEVTTIEYNLQSIPEVDLADFQVDTEYSLLVREGQDGYNMVVANKTTEVKRNEVCRFKVSGSREITFTQNFSTNRFYLGRLGFKNLEYTKVRAIPYPSLPGSVGRIELVVPKDVPALQILFKGEVFNFSNTNKEIIISTEEIPGSYFSTSGDVNVILELEDPSSEDYGARLVLKRDTELSIDDVVIAVIPETRQTDDRGNLIVEENKYLEGEIKTGTVKFEEGESVRRVVFEVPYDFDKNTTIISPTDDKNYSINLYANDNVVTYYTDKTTRGFWVHVEDGVDFTDEVYWKTVAYEKVNVKTRLVDSSSYLGGLDAANYAVMLQAGENVNAWVSSVSEDNFVIETDVSFVGDVDFMIIEDKDFSKTPEPNEVGQIYISKGETEFEVNFNTIRGNSDYQVFLQPNDNVRVWYVNKTTKGFTVKVEPETDFFGLLDWQIYESTRTGTIKFGGDDGFRNEPELVFTDLPETSNLGFIEQGLGKISLIESTGLIDPQANGLQLDYNVDEDLNPGLSFEIKDTTISYNNLRVFVETTDGTWVEYTEAKDFKREINEDSNVFYVRVNKDQYIDVKFGDNDFRGNSPLGSSISIIGMECVGVEGNIGPNVLSTGVVGSFNFQNSNIVTDKVAVGLLEALSIKQDVFFNGVTPTIIDYKGNRIGTESLTIIQSDNASNGSNPEGVEDIRNNAQYAYRSQNRVVTKEDYQNAVLSNFKDVVDSVEVFNYKEVQDTGLVDLGTEPTRYFNTLFFLMVPSFGFSFSFLQRKTIKEFLDDEARKITSIESVILEPTFVEIDVLILYSPAPNTSAIVARNTISESIYNFFKRENRTLGETITVSDVRSAIPNDDISTLEIQLKRDDKSEFGPSDYDVDITPDEYEDAFEENQERKLDEAVKRELRNLIGKGLIELKQPLFDVQAPDGTRKWLFVNEIELGRFEFAVLGDVVIERKV